MGLTSSHPHSISIDSVVFCGADACDPATDRPRYMCSSRPHPMLCSVMRPKSYFAAPHTAHRSILQSNVSYAHFHAVLLISSLKGGWSCLHFQVWSNFDSIFKLLKITLVASSYANDVEDIDLGRVWACPNITLQNGPFLWKNGPPANTWLTRYDSTR